MTKAEIKTALELKFYKVGDWKGGFPEVFGVARYDIDTFTKEGGLRSYTVHVEEEGTAKEDAYFIGKDPTEDEPEPTKIFNDEVYEELEKYKEAGTIVDAYIGKFGPSVAEVVVFKASGDDVVKEERIIYKAKDGTMVFKKLV